MADKMIDKVYSAETTDEQERVYDAWADQYERDLLAMGYRCAFAASSAFCRFVSPQDGPILDAGCGAGLQSEPLALLGYGPITGVDLSEGMLSAAAEKGVYAHLRKTPLGPKLDFPDDSFAAAITVGAITQGHAPANSFEGLVAAVRPGGKIVFTLRCDAGVDPDYRDVCPRLEKAGLWRELFTSKPFLAMPYGEPDVFVRAQVFEVL